jgi:hypothetical protein
MYHGVDYLVPSHVHSDVADALGEPFVVVPNAAGEEQQIPRLKRLSLGRNPAPAGGLLQTPTRQLDAHLPIQPLDEAGTVE